MLVVCAIGCGQSTRNNDAGTGGDGGSGAGGATTSVGGNVGMGITASGTNTAATGETASSGAGDPGGSLTAVGTTNGGTSSGGTGSGGSTGAGGSSSVEGSTSAGGTGAAGSGGVASSGGGGTVATDGVGPCNLYGDAGTPCVAAYSMVRALSSDYDGPLYQIRSGSNSQNPGSGGQTHDVSMTDDGFVDASAVDAACDGTICTVSLIYDQSGRGNDLALADYDRSSQIPQENFEALIDRDDGYDQLTVAGHPVYSLYFEARRAYRLGRVGDGVPIGNEAQGIYLLADGTHYGSACCWDFGNAPPQVTPSSVASDALLLGIAYWGSGADMGPWFLADFGLGVWAGGTDPGDPGWGLLGEDGTANPNNPALMVPFALGFLKTDASAWSLRMADVLTADAVTTAYAGGLPVVIDNEGSIVLGVGGDNSNVSWGTFYEGAVVAGFPSDDVEHEVMRNVQAAGYGR